MGNKNNKNGARPLNDKEINLLISQTGLSRQQVLDWHRQFLSEYPDGFIDKVTFYNYFYYVCM